jgi:hypothetical protein
MMPGNDMIVRHIGESFIFSAFKAGEGWGQVGLIGFVTCLSSTGFLNRIELWLGFGNLNSAYLQYASCMRPSVRRSQSRNPVGELFGFDRTGAISTQTAEAIAKAAHAFGQEDDLTVLTIVRSQQVNRT